MILGKRLKVSVYGRQGGRNGERSETASELLLAVLLSAAAMGAKGDCASAPRRDACHMGETPVARTRRDAICLNCFVCSPASARRCSSYRILLSVDLGLVSTTN